MNPPVSAGAVRGLPPLEVPAALARAGVSLWLVAVLAVAFLSLSPGFGPPGAFHVDKLLHALAYAGLTGLPFVVFARARAVYAAALLMLPMGFGLEIAQDFIPARAADAGDALANVLGVAFGAATGPRGRALANRWLGPKG